LKSISNNNKNKEEVEEDFFTELDDAGTGGFEVVSRFLGKMLIE